MVSAADLFALLIIATGIALWIVPPIRDTRRIERENRERRARIRNTYRNPRP